MSTDKLLEELTETLSNVIHKDYVKSYISDKEKGLSAKFDEMVEANIHEA